MVQNSENEKIAQEIQEIQETPTEREEKIFQKIDFSFLPPEERILEHSCGWRNYVETSKRSLRTLKIVNIIAALISAGILFIGFYFSEGEQNYIPIFGIVLIFYIIIVFIPDIGKGLICTVGPFEFIPIMKYKKIFTNDELDPYYFYKLLTSNHFIAKSIKYPTKKWSFYQKEHLVFEKDRVSCPLNKIEHIIIEAKYLSDFRLQIIGDKTKFEEGKPSNLYQLLKLKLSSMQLTEFLPLFYELKKNHQFTIEMKGTDERWIYFIILGIMILTPFLKFLLDL